MTYCPELCPPTSIFRTAVLISKCRDTPISPPNMVVTTSAPATTRIRRSETRTHDTISRARSSPDRSLRDKSSAATRDRSTPRRRSPSVIGWSSKPSPTTKRIAPIAPGSARKRGRIIVVDGRRRGRRRWSRQGRPEVKTQEAPSRRRPGTLQKRKQETPATPPPTSVTAPNARCGRRRRLLLLGAERLVAPLPAFDAPTPPLAHARTGASTVNVALLNGRSRPHLTILTFFDSVRAGAERVPLKLSERP